MKKIKIALLSTLALLTSVSPALAQDITITINKPPYAPGNISKLINSVLTMVFVITAVLAFAYLVWGGIQWITSGGDKTATEAARNRIQAAILGLFIVFAAWAIMLVLGSFFGFDLGNLAIPKAD